MAALLLSMSIFVFEPAPAYAASSIKTLKAGTTYSVDLNGGGNESVKYTVSKDSSYVGTFHLYVNGTQVYSRKLSSVGEPTGVSSVTLVDVKRSDKYKELFVNVGGDCSDWWVFAVRYYSPSKVAAYTKSSGTRAFAKRARNDTDYMKASGNGRFYLNVETPYHNQTFGCYYVLAPAKLSGNKIVYGKASAYKLVGVKGYTKYVFGSKYYKLSRSMKLYKSYSGKSVKGTCASGTKFTPLYIHVGSTIKGSYGLTYSNLYVKVKTSSGKTGWLYFPGRSSTKYLTQLPAWG